MTMYDSVSLFIPIQSYVCLCMTLNDSAWSCMIKHGFVWLYVTIWLYMTLHDLYDFVWLCINAKYNIMFNYVWHCMNMHILDLQGPYGPLRNSSPCRGLARFAHKGFGSFRISGNKKQRCDWPWKRWTQFIKK